MEMSVDQLWDAFVSENSNIKFPILNFDSVMGSPKFGCYVQTFFMEYLKRKDTSKEDFFETFKPYFYNVYQVLLVK